MGELLKSFSTVVVKTGGLALLVIYPLIPFILICIVLGTAVHKLQQGTERIRRRKLASEILSAPRTDWDEFYREIARTILLH